MKKKSALLVSVTMVLVAVLALTTASFAWFTASMNPSVESFDVNVTTGEALLVSTATDGAFKTTLTSDELKVLPGNNLLQTTGDKLNAATPTTLDTNKKIKLVDTIVTDKYAVGDIAFSRPTALDTGDFTKGYDDAFVKKEATGKTYHFIKFDIFFKASVSGAATNVDVSLDLSSKDNTSAYTGTEFYGVNAKGDTLDYATTYQGQIAKVLRVAFVPVTGANATIVAGSDVAKVYEPDSNRLTEAATISPKPGDALVETGHLVDPTLSTAGKPAVQANNMPLFTLLAGKTAQMTVYIWIEGNDLDCVNEVSTALFRSNIKFAGKVATPAVP